MKVLVALLALCAFQACSAYQPTSHLVRGTRDVETEVEALVEAPVDKVSGLSKAFGGLFRASNWIEDKVDSVKSAAKKLVGKVRGARDVETEVEPEAEPVDKVSGLSKAFGGLFRASNWIEDKVDSVKSAAKKLVGKVRGARDVETEVEPEAEPVEKISGLSKAFGGLFRASNWIEDKVDSVKSAAKKVVSKLRQ